jgi:hypothetical protein
VVVLAIFGFLGLLGVGLTLGFVGGVWYGARLQEARAKMVKDEPVLEPQFRSPEWMKQRLDVIEKETRGKQDIDFPRSYEASKSMGLDG